IHIDEDRIPIQDEVKGACEILGLDPLHVANEGKLVAVVAREDAERVLAAMRTHPLGQEAAIIGEVVEDPRHLVLLRTRIGGFRVVSMLAGEQLPRIC
ncbi:MAG: AIR synthase-related protein, partial [Thermoflexus sp.]